MIHLNLPPAHVKLKKSSGQVWIWDIIRRKYIVLTPEEWVRQHFVHYLIYHKNYPRPLIKVERGLTYHQLQKRSDIVVFNREGKPWMIVECKAPDQLLSQRTAVQASVYNKTLQANFLVITNGLLHLFFATDWQKEITESIPELPSFPS
jgi:hypothetical protein